MYTTDDMGNWMDGLFGGFVHEANYETIIRELQHRTDADLSNMAMQNALDPESLSIEGLTEGFAAYRHAIIAGIEANEQNDFHDDNDTLDRLRNPQPAETCTLDLDAELGPLAS
jgi:hypothetical protein